MAEERPYNPLRDSYMPAEVTIIVRDPNLRQTAELTGLRGVVSAEVEYEPDPDRGTEWRVFRENRPVKYMLNVDMLVSGVDLKWWTVQITDWPDEDPEPEPWKHEGHKPVQHRDKRPPWCPVCGWSSPIPARPAVHLKEVKP